MIMMKYFKNPCFIYTMLWCIYWCQGILYQSGGIISQSIAIVLLCISLLCTFKYISSNRIIGYPKALLVVLLIVSIYGIIAYITDGEIIRGKTSDTRLFSWFKNMYLSILPVFTYLYFVRERYMNTEFVRKIIPVLIVAVSCSYYWSYISTIQAIFINTGNDISDITNNSGYMVLSLLPLLLLYDNKRLWQYVGLSLIVFFVVLSAKRGAILICGIMSVLFIIRNYRYSSGHKKLLTILLMIGFFIIVYSFIMDYMSENDYLMKRIEETKEGRSNGRDDLYWTLWDSFKNQNDTWKYLFGGGVWYTTKLTWTAAHNDWLEFLIDMGLFGVCVYMHYWVSFYRLSFNKNIPELSRFCIFLVFLNMFMKTLFSMSIDTMTFIHSMMLGLSYHGLLYSNNRKHVYTNCR